MWRKLIFILALAASQAFAEKTKTTYNPFTGKLDYITKIDCGSNPVGVQFIDANSCTWCETIDTSGVLTTALVSCGASILMENGTYILQENGTKITVE